MSTMRLRSEEHPLVRCLASVDSALDDVAELDPADLSTPVKARVLRSVDRELSRLEGLRLQLVTASGDASTDDVARPADDWLRPESDALGSWPEVRSALHAMLSSIPPGSPVA
jgi:hypothetical protein